MAKAVHPTKGLDCMYLNQSAENLNREGTSRYLFPITPHFPSPSPPHPGPLDGKAAP